MTPVYVACIIPLKDAGEWLLGLEHVHVSIAQAKEDPWDVVEHSPEVMIVALADSSCMHAYASSAQTLAILDLYCLQRRRCSVMRLLGGVDSLVSSSQCILRCSSLLPCACVIKARQNDGPSQVAFSLGLPFSFGREKVWVLREGILNAGLVEESSVR